MQLPTTDEWILIVLGNGHSLCGIEILRRINKHYPGEEIKSGVFYPALVRTNQRGLTTCPDYQTTKRDKYHSITEKGREVMESYQLFRNHLYKDAGLV